MKKSNAPTLTIDFLSPQMQYRLRHASLRKEKLARAMGKKPSEHPRIVDATAGLGRDALVLAWLGYEVTMIERSDVLYEKLHEALKRASEDADLGKVVARLRLIHADAIHWLRALSEGDRPDVIYIDPMFPERRKSALAKKDMVFLQHLLGHEDDSLILFQTALACAKNRVVVKRPRLGAYMDQSSPTFSITGSSSRFDIYVRGG